MTGARYDCAQPRRRDRVRERAQSIPINGIDYLEVAADQRTVEVRFLSAHGLDRLATGSFVVEGGERVTGITVEVTAADAGRQTVTLRASSPGDFSRYVLRLVVPPEDAGGTIFDPRLSAVPFSFKVSRAGPYDCGEAPDADTPPASPPPDLDHLAKDYDSFRRLMLDRMAVTAPGWTERNPADVLVTLVEMLAAVADELSWAQDAAATEAYLGTARLRRSVCRHARLLGYRAHSGCNARAFVRFTSDAVTVVPGGVEVMNGVAGPVPQEEPLPEGTVVFRTLDKVSVHPQADEIGLYTWSDEQCCLPAGATAATLVQPPVIGDQPPLQLDCGDFLLLETAGPDGAPADPARRHVVRLTAVTAGSDPVEDTPVLEVEWGGDDALPFALHISRENGATAVARAGIAVAEHARPVPHGVELPLESPGSDQERPAGGQRPYRPRLPGTGLTFHHAYHPAVPAARQLVRDPRIARPCLTVSINGETWEPSPVGDLLGSGPDDRHFVTEIERDGTAWLRFGDGAHGARPPDDRSEVRAIYSTGNGAGGNVGRATLTGFRLRPDPGETAAITGVTNPLEAAGGTDAEPLERIRASAPQAFLVQQRAVTAEDYATILERHPVVQRARARRRWTGSWYTVFVAVDLLGGRELDPGTEAELRAFLDGFRMAGHDLELTGPVHVDVDLALLLRAAPGVPRDGVRHHARDVLSGGLRRNGTPGLFHPDRFTFGQPLFLSEVVAAVAAIPGVVSARATRFQRLGMAAAGELEAEVLRTAPQEIVRLAADVNAPEHGRLEIDVVGGA
ncbi:putative baseplate assembly protein [Geodermatophilus obscurus]|uniref:Putative baseplate assembly protein n=1 Tax=Geodermatophilus obscurus TaxID=1861 RepID=A0A1M7S3G6_9ACTN|nr:putative baseplate assembly protein [Geodermatophilus obscurus]SHN52971.1 putative baseplate assembly protein [Geodermatophilus obscurus]